jgi:histone deacetylase 1/2
MLNIMLTPSSSAASANFPVMLFANAIQRAKPATKREMTQFHSDEYVDFLSRVTPTNMNSYIKEQHKCKSTLLYLSFLTDNIHCYVSAFAFDYTDNVGDDCPVFDGLFDYCAISAGGSMGMLI